MDSYNSIKKYFHRSLKGVYPPSEIDNIFFLILFKFFKWNKIDFTLNRNNLPSNDFLLHLNQIVPDLIKNKPIQHILGFVSFYGLELMVNEHVLIPRPETEELVAKILSELDSNSTLSVLDIGTGSGCIPLSLKNECPNLVCRGVDISIKALEVAKKNANRLNLDVDFCQQDVLSKSFNSDMIDILVSNPPYIPNNEISLISSNVVDYEPHSALFVDEENPLLFYNRIAIIGNKYLKKNGKIYFEIHENYGDQIVNLLSNLNYSNILVFQDLQGKDRMIKASK